MKQAFIIPSLLIFLGGMATGFSLFPYLAPPQRAQLVQPPTPEPETSPQAQQQVPEPALSAQAVPAPNTPEGSVLQLFSPTSAELDAMHDDSAQQKLLEQTLMVSFLLSNCEMMSTKDYEQTFKTLVEYLKANGTANPDQTAVEAAKRAKASYRMLYKNVPCDDPSLIGLRNSLADWRNSVSSQITN